MKLVVYVLQHSFSWSFKFLCMVHKNQERWSKEWATFWG